MIQFCHIAPISLLDIVSQHNQSHLILAHLVEKDQKYSNFFSRLQVGADAEKIMDNSAFEMFKQGRPMFNAAKLVDLANQCNATVIVLPDYPKEHHEKTIDAAKQYIPIVKEAGFKTFFVPQSKPNDLDGYMNSLSWAIDNKNIDYIGLSILGCPIALGLDEKPYGAEYNSYYKMQRFLSRWHILNQLAKLYDLNDERLQKRFHCLGLVDGPNEIELLSKFKPLIKSWDSSSAVWAGINNVKYDSTPTGLLTGKIESEVDFDTIVDYNDSIEYNIHIIKLLCES